MFSQFLCQKKHKSYTRKISYFSSSPLRGIRDASNSTTVQVETFALKNVCDFSNPANIEFFANRNYLRFFIPFESLKGKKKPLRKFIFAITQHRKKRI